MASKAINPSTPPVVAIRKISKSDLDASLREGYRDFLENRGDLIIAGAIYPLVGLIAAVFFVGGSALPMLFPVVAGLVILGPLVSAGFYELARRKEEGEPTGWSHFFGFWKGGNLANLMYVGVLLIGIFALWLIAAFMVYGVFFGAMAPVSIGDFLTRLFTTGDGWGLIVVGNLVGLAFAVLVLAVSFVSLPMLVDRRARVGRALRVSLRAFQANRTVVLRWGATVIVLLAVGSIPFFLGLAVVLPVLGYATWHLYTRVVDRDTAPRI